MDSEIRKLCDIAEELGWSVYEGEDYIELSFMPDAGEDFSFSVNNIDCIGVAAREIYDYWHDFDPDEHTAMWVEAKQNGVRGVPSIRKILEDSDKIDAKLKELSERISDELRKGTLN